MKSSEKTTDIRFLWRCTAPNMLNDFPAPIILMAMHVVTGGPCSGKTTLVRKLKDRGFDVVEEAAEKMINEYQKIGRIADRSDPAFQNSVFELQLELENASIGKDMVFCDRGILDGYAYVKLHDRIPSYIYEEIAPKRYESVFLLSMVPDYKQTEIRKEPEEEARLIHGMIKDAYREFGYKPIEVPDIGPEKRMEMVLGHVKRNGRKH
jgi:predicted ATPase